MKLILVARNAFAASLIISAEATLVRTTGASNPSYNAATRSPEASSSEPITIRSGCMKSSTALPSERNSGFDTYPTRSSPRWSSAARIFSPVPTGTVLFMTRVASPGSPRSSITDQT
jgi:hypothetical protein